MMYMTVKDILDYVDEVKHNTFSRKIKLIWLNELEYRVQTDVMLIAAESITYVPDDDSHQLLVPAPWSEIYYDYLLMKLSEHLEESSEQNNRAATFDKAFTRFMRWWADTYRPANGNALFKGYYLKGEKGDPFEYEDFTEEQLAALKGPAGAAGTTYTPHISEAGVLSWTNESGKTNPDPVNIKGPAGADGAAGATFMPSVSADGTLSWTNDKGLTNPEAVNIMGPQGEDGADGAFRVTVTHSGGISGIYSADKTFDEIKAAYDAGQQPYVVDDTLFNSDTIYTLSLFLYDDSSAQGFADFERHFMREDTLETETLRIYSHTLASGSNIELQISEFNATGGSVVIEGTASDDMSEVTITTPDAWTLVSEAWNSEKRPLVVLRLSDELYAYLTSVSTWTIDGQSQGMALFCLPPFRHLNSAPPYSIWLDESGGASILPVEGINGTDGIGIQSVEQTVTSTEDGGTNIIAVTKTDGTSSTFTVKNGSKGSTGATGADGKSAYQYAQESGYTGTEAEFAKKLASRALTVHVTESNGTLSADKSYNDIENAILDGIPVLVDYGGTTLPLIVIADALLFGATQCINDGTDTLAGSTIIEITQNGEVNDISAYVETLPNPNAVTFTGAVTGSYDGTAPMTVNIPSAVTDAHINSLIDTKLGVIENGSY